MESTAAPDPLGFEAARDAARVGLYLHVPFCAVRCAFCHFSSGPVESARVERWLAALALEAQWRAPQARGVRFSSVFVGGGTPSILSSRHFRVFWSIVRDHFEIAPDAEQTLEANPESVRPSLLETWAAAGINRLSMGAQSFDAAELEGLGRLHGPERPGEAFALARAAGFRRLSLDLMYGFPAHRRETFARSLDRALALEPEHLSAYCFIAEEDTPLGRDALSGRVALPEPELQADLFEDFVAASAHRGYSLYETANACRPGGAARHNLVYWLRRDYLALGPSAHGLWRGVRYANPYGLEPWAQALERGEEPAALEPETEDSRTEETLMLALRLSCGLQRRDHEPGAWRRLEARFGAALAAAVREGRLERQPDGWRIAAPHRFVADDVIAWVAARADAARVDSARARSVTSSPCPSLSSPVAPVAATSN
ncbi:MAG: radical SAM family heme chaperone HemW [Candidatus Eisenbacteria bacterium]|uniref:Heme chaperone HemW n=1 Tax=Eiseniibacteriota bacterium TaxID=2212470 RepID=A0A849SFU5_UNCEI|nr:radical SAM family heme chaperone HemW [Candidatus Eisenbacteria bacterium]